MPAPVFQPFTTMTYNAYQADVNTASSAWVVFDRAGVIDSVRGIAQAATTTADSAITFKVDGTTVSGMTSTVTFTSSAAGDINTATVPRGVVVGAGSKLEIVSDGAGSTTVPMHWTVTLNTNRYF